MSPSTTPAYQLVFSLQEAGFQAWPLSAAGFIFVVIGLVAWRYPQLLPFRGPRRWSTPFRYFFLGFAVLWTVIAFTTTWRDYSAAKSALEENRASVVEGLVSKFEAMPVTGHAKERFCVRETCFENSDYIVSAGFHTTSSHGGPIREGLPVRVTYVGNTIVRLEVAK